MYCPCIVLKGLEVSAHACCAHVQSVSDQQMWLLVCMVCRQAVCMRLLIGSVRGSMNPAVHDGAALQQTQHVHALVMLACVQHARLRLQQHEKHLALSAEAKVPNVTKRSSTSRDRACTLLLSRLDCKTQSANRSLAKPAHLPIELTRLAQLQSSLGSR